jgi:hypothetical protein
MNAMKMPGFTAGSTVNSSGTFSRARQAGQEVGGPFSGSCGWYGWYSCCVLCWYDQCYWWCWAPSRLPTGY